MIEPAEYEYLMPEFLQAMNEIGRLGAEKHKIESFHHARQAAAPRGGYPRYQTQIITDHIRGHTSEYQNGMKHDKFGTLGHQLAAVAFNAMMEYYFANLATEQPK